MPKKPPDKWFDEKSKVIRKSLKEAHPTWGKSKLEEKTRETVGDLWFNKLTESKRQEILAQSEKGNPGWKSDAWNIIVLSLTTTITVIVILWLVSLTKKARLPSHLCVNYVENYMELMDYPERVEIHFYNQTTGVVSVGSVAHNWPHLIDRFFMLLNGSAITQLQYECGLAQGRLIFGQ